MWPIFEDDEEEPDQGPPYYDLPLDVDVKTLIGWWEYMAFSNRRLYPSDAAGYIVG